MWLIKVPFRIIALPIMAIDCRNSSIGSSSFVHPFSGTRSGTYCKQWYPLLFRCRRKGKQHVFF